MAREMDIEWRVGFTVWPHGHPGPRVVQRATTDEADAREQYEGLLAMLAPHPLRACDEHIWSPKLERGVITREWKVVAEG